MYKWETLKQILKDERYLTRHVSNPRHIELGNLHTDAILDVMDRLEQGKSIYNTDTHCKECSKLPQCDICGRFISMDDFEKGAARNLLSSDSEFTKEEYETFCIQHATER